MKKRRTFQKVLLIIAVLSYIAAACCGAGAAYLGGEINNPIIASLMASVVFFAGSGIVLQVIASTDLPSLKVGGDDQNSGSA